MVVLVSTGLVALGFLLGAAWSWWREGAWADYGRQHWQCHDAVSDIQAIRQNAEAAMRRAAPQKGRE